MFQTIQIILIIFAIFFGILTLSLLPNHNQYITLSKHQYNCYLNKIINIECPSINLDIIVNGINIKPIITYIYYSDYTKKVLEYKNKINKTFICYYKDQSFYDDITFKQIISNENNFNISFWILCITTLISILLLPLTICEICNEAEKREELDENF